jgi:hypothetical protein
MDAMCVFHSLAYAELADLLAPCAAQLATGSHFSFIQYDNTVSALYYLGMF